MEHQVAIEMPRDFFSRTDSLESDSESTDESSERKINLLPWKIFCLVLAVVMAMGWLGMITLLILKEEWQLVLVAWLLFYAAGHFSYWYFRKRRASYLSHQTRQRLMARLHGTDAVLASEDPNDCPPSYDELVKCETPPPTYRAVIHESPKLRRALGIQSLTLPWFLKRKAMSQTVVDVTDAPHVGTTPRQGSVAHVVAQKSCNIVNVCDIPVTSLQHADESYRIELPSYESLMRQSGLPVLTPIHQALARLPRLPSTKAPKKLETIAEDEQQP